MLLLAVSPASGFGQTATPAEAEAVQEIAQCLVQGAPQDWQRLYMVIELPEPGASTGRVKYLAMRDFAADADPYVPCDAKHPAQVLMDSRANQSAERRGWVGARLIVHRTGRFDLNYDYPK